MKNRLCHPLTPVALLTVLCLTACGKSGGKSSVLLDQGYRQADAGVRQQVEEVRRELQASNYTAAVQTLDRVVWEQLRQGQPLTPEQKQAVQAVIGESRRAVNRNPRLNTPEFYRATANLTDHAFGEN